MSFLISDAFAEGGAAASQGGAQGLLSMLPMIILLVLFMYLMVIRPQTKKSKEHKALMESLQKGDEVITVSGVLGKIEKITDNFIILSIAENTQINLQKNSISAVVPRGTIKNIKS